MANVRTRGTDKVKVVSAVITLAVIVALVFGIFSVAQNVKKSKNNNLVVYSGDIEPSARGFRATLTDE